MDRSDPRLGAILRAGLSLAAWGCFAVAGVCLLLVVLMAYEGGPWGRLIYAEKPIPHFMGGLAALSAWYVILFGHRNSRQQWLQVAGRAVLLLTSLTFSLVAGEFALRACYSARQSDNSFDQLKKAHREGKPMPIRSTHPLALIIQPSEDPAVIYELQPNLDLQFGHHRLRTNKRGMRESRDYPLERAPGSIRVVGIGDSGMFGWNLEQGDDYLSVMETNLNSRQDGTLYEVLNLAVPGYNTQLEVGLFRNRGLAYKPDIVVVGWCENDFRLPMFLLQKENYRRRDVSFLYDWLFKRADHFTEVGQGLTIHDLRDYDTNCVAPKLMAGVDESGVRIALSELRQLGEESGFKILVFGPMAPQVCRLCTDLGIPYTNTYELIPTDKYPNTCLVHFMHPSRDGHRALAEELEQDLRRRGWLPAARPVTEER